jgi:acetate---CoA ligase (ADP-forming) subunit beta
MRACGVDGSPPRELMLEPAAVDLLAAYGIPYPEHRFARSVEEVGKAAQALGCPVVIKVVSSGIAHKSDVGGVVLGIGDAEAARDVAERMGRSLATLCPEADVAGYLVCRQAEPGHDIIIGGLRDQTFGPAVMFGMGGVFTELYRDVSFRIAAIGDAEARRMITEVRAYPVLVGARGGPSCDLGELAGLLVGVSHLLIEHPAIVEIDLNPVRAGVCDAAALDARVVTT